MDAQFQFGHPPSSVHKGGKHIRLHRTLDFMFNFSSIFVGDLDIVLASSSKTMKIYSFVSGCVVYICVIVDVCIGFEVHEYKRIELGRYILATLLH